MTDWKDIFAAIKKFSSHTSPGLDWYKLQISEIIRNNTEVPYFPKLN